MSILATLRRLPAEHPPIGGFFERHEPDGAISASSLLEAWTRGRPYAAFGNARSAFAALAAGFPDAAIWMPAFLCRDMVGAAYARRVRPYPVLEGFEPDLAAVEAYAAPGDLVLLMAWFGLPPRPAVRAFASRRPDLRLVEDCAHALAPAKEWIGEWRLFSPRKLLGVADGGVLVARGAGTVLPQPFARPDAEALWAAPMRRAADPMGSDNAAWHAANQAKEGGMRISAEAISLLSFSILSTTSLECLARPRLDNWRVLDRRLRTWSALAVDLAAPPLGYVLRLEPEARERVRLGLRAERIFAAVHWPTIVGGTEDFQREQQWTRELLTLPCDHRYGAAEMERIAHRVVELIG